ncbi:MAG TPA: tripartite tricarboxylate transporter substrate-binding protein, partial [Burkholderiaceae bacterium]|nr:tripartite tricarboxylate transporter substrate-binding protein [Burkholderiaceae bacterium]
YMMLAPRGTPPEIVRKLNAEINKAMQDPELRQRLGSQGVDFVGGAPEDADRFLRSEIERWRTVSKATGMKGN